jgi:general stress protein YciG
MSSKLRDTMITKYGSEEAWKEHMREVGRKGGSVKRPNRGFGNGEAGRARARKVGSLGGRISRRRKLEQ